MRNRMLSLGTFAVIAIVALLSFHRSSASPPSGDNVQTAVSAPANTPAVPKTAGVGHATISMFADLSVDGGGLGKDYVTQNESIENDKNNTIRICVEDVALSDAGTCALTCGRLDAGTITCSGASADGEWVDPGETKPKRLTGKMCECGEAALSSVDAGTVTYQSVRLAR